MFVRLQVDPSLGLGAQYLGVKQKRIYNLATRLSSLHDHIPVYGPDSHFRIYGNGQWYSTTWSTTWHGIQGLDLNAPWILKLSLAKTVLYTYCLENLVDSAFPATGYFAQWMDSMTVGDWVKYQNLHPWVNGLWKMGVIDILFVEPDDISLLHFIWYIKTNGGFFDEVTVDSAGGPQQYSVVGGLQSLAERWAAELRSTKIQLNSPVESVVSDSSGILTVRTSDGKSFKCRTVAVCVGAAVINKIAFSTAVSRTMTHSFDFKTNDDASMLHPTRRNFFSGPRGFADRAVIQYDTPWWRAVPDPEDPNRVIQYYGFSSGGDFDLAECEIAWGLDTSIPSQNLNALSVFINPTLFEKVRNRGLQAEEYDRAVRQEFLNALVKLSGCEEARKGVKQLQFYEWNLNSWVGGAPNTYSRPGVSSFCFPKYAEANHVCPFLTRHLMCLACFIRLFLCLGINIPRSPTPHPRRPIPQHILWWIRAR